MLEKSVNLKRWLVQELRNTPVISIIWWLFVLVLGVIVAAGFVRSSVLNIACGVVAIVIGVQATHDQIAYPGTYRAPLDVLAMVALFVAAGLNEINLDILAVVPQKMTCSMKPVSPEYFH